MDASTPQTATGTPVTAAAGMFALFALFLSLTAYIAIRNVLGDTGLKKAFAVGSVPAAIAVVFTSFGWGPFIALAFAPSLDFGLVKYLYGRSTRLSTYVIITHFIVPVLLGFVPSGLSATPLTASF